MGLPTLAQSAHLARRRRTARPLLLMVAATLAVMVVRFTSRSFVAEGSWESGMRDIKHFPTGIESSVGGVVFDQGGLKFSVEDGHLAADYERDLGNVGRVSVGMTDDQAWKLGFADAQSSVRLRGKGAELERWAASRRQHVEGLGDVAVDVDSDKQYNLQVAPKIAPVLGAQVDATLRASNNGVAARLEGQRNLTKKVGVRYSVENDVGDYDPSHLQHHAAITAKLGGESLGKATMEVATPRAASKDGARDIEYAAFYDQPLPRFLPADSNVRIGVDNDGMFGKLSASRELGAGIAVEAETNLRSRPTAGDTHDLARESSLKLSNDLGYVGFRQPAGESPRLQVGYKFDA